MAQGLPQRGLRCSSRSALCPAAADADVADIDQGPAKLLTALSEQGEPPAAPPLPRQPRRMHATLVSSLVALGLVTGLGVLAGLVLTRSVVRHCAWRYPWRTRWRRRPDLGHSGGQQRTSPRLLQALKAMQDNLENVVSGVRSGAESVASASAEIARAMPT